MHTHTIYREIDLYMLHIFYITYRLIYEIKIKIFIDKSTHVDDILKIDSKVNYAYWLHGYIV